MQTIIYRSREDARAARMEKYRRAIASEQRSRAGFVGRIVSLYSI